jgi:hypothetical protein
MKHTDKIKPKHHTKPSERQELVSEGIKTHDSESKEKSDFRHLVQEFNANKGWEK